MKRRSTACAALTVCAMLSHNGAASAAEHMVRWGTGFFVSKSGHVLTNFHVAESCRQLTVQSGRGTSPARIVAMDAANDLALLATGLKPAAVAEWHTTIADSEPVVIH